MTQEPWCMKMNGCKTKYEDCPDEPPQRTWVGLTDGETAECFETKVISDRLKADAKRIEAKIKEKNT